MKKLPLAITTFEKIRDKAENYLYIDKTELACQLIENGEYYFLSRPRRFGKSLFLDTLSDLFQAKKTLFEGLAIYEQWDWNVPYPVILIEFNGGDFQSENSIQKRIVAILKRIFQGLILPIPLFKPFNPCFIFYLSICRHVNNKLTLYI